MDYVIGDLHGCYEALQLLLKKINFDEFKDRLWFCGDFVNRGPDALSVLRFVSSLKVKPCVVLGNHDLHFLAVYFGVKKSHSKYDAFDKLLSAPDIEFLVQWLLSQNLAVVDLKLGFLLTHAGICPTWKYDKVLALASEVETALRDPLARIEYFSNMYGNLPDTWHDDLAGCERLRVITNYLTRMRYLDKKTHALLLQHKTITSAENAVPWFELTIPSYVGCELLFGHWAAMKGNVTTAGIYGLDTGCYFDGTLTAMCLQTKEKHQIVHV